MSSNEVKSNFKFDQEQISLATADFLKKPAKSLSYIYILFVFLLFIVSILYLVFTKVAITIEADSHVSTPTPLTKITTDIDFKIDKVLVHNGQLVQKGEALILGANRINPENYLSYRQEIQDINIFLQSLLSNRCDSSCLKLFRKKAFKLFRYLTFPELKEQVHILRKDLFSLTTLTNNTFANKINSIKLQILDLEEVIDFNQRSQIIHAPSTGTVLFSKKVAKGGLIKKGEMALEVIPSNHSVIIKSFIKDQDINKIKKGMPVKVAIDAFPPREYGLIDGTIKFISIKNSTIENRQHYYEIEISLKQQEFIKKSEKFPLLIGMNGKALIITEYASLFKKYFGKIIGIN